MTISEYITNLKIQLYGGNFTTCPDSWRSVNVSCAFHKLYFPVDGSADITANGVTHILKKGQMMLIPKGVRHSFSLTEEKKLTKYWLHFTALSDGKDLFENYRDITVWDFTNQEGFDRAVRECGRIFAPKGENAVGRALNRQAALYALFALILEKEKSTEKISFTAARPAAVTEYIENHLAEAIKVEELAQIVYMHPTAFIRYFKGQFGMPPLKYIKCLRLEKAKHYLESTDLTVREIAELTGFRDASHFGHEFKLTYGLAPGQVQKGAAKAPMRL